MSSTRTPNDPVPVPIAGRAIALSRMLPTISVTLVLGLLVGLLMVNASSAHSHTSTSAGASTSGGHDHMAAGAAALPGAGQKVTLQFELGEMFIKPKEVTVPAGTEVTMVAVNKGSQAHTIGLMGHVGKQLQPGESQTQNWGVLTESTQAWCAVAGHKDAGMLVDIKVTGGTTTAVAAGDAATATQDPDAGNAKIDAAAKPSAGWTARDPVAPRHDGKKVHEVTFEVIEKEIEVAPGVTQLRWTFNGTAPGPTLRGKVGDLFKVKLVNKGTMNHSIDFHASKVAPNVQMRSIKPGESLVYEFEAKFAGVFTYHCGTDPMIHHMGNGMSGAVIIDPPDLGEVDQELVFVQSELYLGPQGQVSPLKKMLDNDNDAVVFNGYYNQYVHAPIKVKPGARLRVWVDDAGPNENLAFHVVGTIFDTVWKEGNYTLRRDNPEKGGSQVLDLQPTQGGFVEFTLPDAGTYPFVGHKMANLSRGALGVFQVG